MEESKPPAIVNRTTTTRGPFMSDPNIIEVRDASKRKKVSAYTAPIALLIVSTVLILPFIVPAIWAMSTADNPTKLDSAAIVADNIIPALLTTFAAELLVVMGFILYAGERKRWRQVLGFTNFTYKSVFIGLILGAVFFAGLSGLEILSSAMGVKVGNSDTVNQFGSLDGLPLIFVLFVCVSVLAPLFEETFFRGFIFGYLVEAYGATKLKLMTPVVIWCIFYPSIWFSFAHFQGVSSFIDFLVLAWTFMFACAASALRFKTKSLYPAIAAHGLYNFAGALFIFFG